MKRQELSHGNYVYCPRLDPEHPYRVYIVDKVRPVVDGDSPYAGIVEDDARVVLRRNCDIFNRRLLGERPGSFIYASELQPIPMNRLFEEKAEELNAACRLYSHRISYHLAIYTIRGAYMEIVFSNVLPRIDGLRWFVDIYDFDRGVSRVHVDYFHQLQNILTALELKFPLLEGHYLFETDDYKPKFL